jgi:hypothetical protein
MGLLGGLGEWLTSTLNYIADSRISTTVPTRHGKPNYWRQRLNRNSVR